MVQKAKEAVEAIEAAFRSDEEKQELRKAALESEKGVLIRHGTLIKYLDDAYRTHEDAKSRLDDFCSVDGKSMGVALAQHGAFIQLNTLASQFASVQAIKACKDEILEAHRAATLEQAKIDLQKYEEEHTALLKKYGAI